MVLRSECGVNFLKKKDYKRSEEKRNWGIKLEMGFMKFRFNKGF